MCYNNHMNELDRDFVVYFAGMIDGDGCITISKHRSPKTPTPIYNLRLLLSQSDKHYLEWLVSKLGTGRIYKREKMSGNLPYNKPGYQLHVIGKDLDTLLGKLLPHVIIKKEQIQVALDFRKTFDYPKMEGKRLHQSVIDERERYKLLLSELKR